MKFLAPVFCISLISVAFCISAQAQTNNEQTFAPADISELRALAHTEKGPSPQTPLPPKPATSGSVEFTLQLSALLTIRDLPQYFNDQAIVKFATQQISIEKAIWGTFFGRKNPETGQPIPPPPMITFEWQKLIDQRPDLAQGPLLDVFINTAPDWSFLRNERGWDPNSLAPPYVVAFLFSRDKVEGRDPEFAAHDLIPVVRQQVAMAIKRAPTHFYFTETLPTWQYDFDAKSIRFPGPSGPTRLNLLMPMFDTETKKGYRDLLNALPAKARTMSDYFMAGGGESLNYNVIQHQMPDDVNPGKNLGSMPPHGWKDAFRFAGLPEPTVIALDRQVQITSVPLDSARAEAVHKEGGQLSARVYFAVDHIELQHPAKKDDNTTMVFGRLEKVEILTRNKEVLVTFKPESFQVAPEVTAPAGSPAAPASPPSTPKSNETNEQRVRRANREMFDKIRAQQEKAMRCTSRARATKMNVNDPEYKKVYDTCMQEN
jgi:hypothetical protein